MIDNNRIINTLNWIERQTFLRTKQAHMLSSGVQSSVLRMLSKMIKPKRILEIGTFTGYSTICLATGIINDDGKKVIDTLEVNDELKDLIDEGFERAGISEMINLHIGKACDILKTLHGPYDLIYIDADKREYPLYYDLVINMLSPDGYIIADNVIWDGKIFMTNPSNDAQTRGIIEFNHKVLADPEVENIILSVRDGLNIIHHIK
ncbi:MAG: O-methyltransferase [Bacteroidales bacterium]